MAIPFLASTTVGLGNSENASLMVQFSMDLPANVSNPFLYLVILFASATAGGKEFHELTVSSASVSLWLFSPVFDPVEMLLPARWHAPTPALCK